VFVGVYACFMAALGVTNLVSGFIGSAVWTIVAFAGALAGLVAARSLWDAAKR
jgi:hypothetical protein